MRGRESGQVLPLVALLFVAVAGAAVLVVRLGGLAADRAQASTAADAAALAAAAEGRDAADRLAAANGGRVLSFEVHGDDTQVRVTVGQASATARARRTGDGLVGSEGPALRATLARAAQLMGRPVPVRRVLADGLTVDIDPSASAELATLSAQTGLCRPDAELRPERFRVCGPPPARGMESVER